MADTNKWVAETKKFCISLVSSTLFYNQPPEKQTHESNINKQRLQIEWLILLNPMAGTKKPRSIRKL